MKDGFIRVAAATPDLKVADPVFNREQTWKMMQEAAARDVKILVFPELGLTGYTCSDLFLQDTLIDQAKEELLWLLDASKDMDMLTFIGLPWMKDGKLYNVAAVIKSGELLGLVPKRHLPNCLTSASTHWGVWVSDIAANTWSLTSSYPGYFARNAAFAGSFAKVSET